jgi:hypothetical protein
MTAQIRRASTTGTLRNAGSSRHPLGDDVIALEVRDAVRIPPESQGHDEFWPTPG